MLLPSGPTIRATLDITRSARCRSRRYASIGRDEALVLVRAVDVASLDGHHTFHLAESFAMAGDIPRALELAERAVDMGFFPHSYFTRVYPFFATLREAPGFERVAAKAAARVAAFEAAMGQ